MAAARDQRGGAGRRPDTLSIIVAFVGNEMSQLPCCLNLRSVGEEGGVGSPLVKTWEMCHGQAHSMQFTFCQWRKTLTFSAETTLGTL